MTILAKNNEFFPSVPSFFDDVMQRNKFFNGRMAYEPAVNIIETDDYFSIELAAPGYNKKDFKINLDNDELTISVENKDQKENEKVNYARKEFGYGPFEKVFTLPEGTIDGNKIKANYQDGVLYILLPKLEEVKPKPAREIAVG